MIITDLQTKHYRIPLRTHMTDSTHGEMTHFEVIMVRVETDAGVDGLGYTYTIGQGGSAIRALIDEAIKPILLNVDPTNVAGIWQQMWWRLHYIGRGGLVSFAIAAVDIALWDLRGKKESTPLWQLAGGSANIVVPYAGGIDLHLTLDQLLQQTADNLAKGFKAIKIKVGQPRLRTDIERAKAVRELIGPDITLMVDANMRWDVATAIKGANLLRDFDIYWLEEPTIPDDVAGHARIAQEGGLPIATGENLHTIYEFQNMIANGRIAYPEPDVSNIGGITSWLRVAQLAYANNLPVTTHGVHELHLHLLAAIPNPSFLEVHSFGLERFILNPPTIKDGKMTASNNPGHGVKFDWTALDEFIIKP